MENGFYDLVREIVENYYPDEKAAFNLEGKSLVTALESGVDLRAQERETEAETFSKSIAKEYIGGDWM